MLKNDFRYIIKKIIIGIGIFIGIFYFRSCQVNASNIQHIEYVEPLYNYTFNYDIDLDTYEHYYLGVYYTSNQVQFKLKMFNGNVTYRCAWESNCNPLGVVDYTKQSRIVANRNENIYNVRNVILTYNRSTGSIVTNYSVSTDSIFIEQYFINRNLATMNPSSSFTASNDIIVLINYDLSVNNNAFTIPKSYYNDNNMYDPTPPPPTDSNIVSLNPQAILSDDNSVLLGYNFTLEFDIFDTDYFVYKYKIGSGRTLIFYNNNYQLSLRNNDTLYVWSEDLEGNVLDSVTFTVSDIGDLYQGEYSIDFIYRDFAPSDTENSTGLSNIIDRVDIDITYLPKTNKLKYQYQFVNEASSLDPQNWIQLNNDNSVNNYVYTTHSNGTLYARILNENDIVVASSTFTVDSIGQIKLFNDNNQIGGIFDSVKNNIDYSGPIYSLILMPINFINIIYSNSSNICQRYKIGTLFNNDIYFECVDFSDYVGSDLYHLIDILCASGVIYGIALFVKKKYNQFTSLSDNDNDIM